MTTIKTIQLNFLLSSCYQLSLFLLIEIMHECHVSYLIRHVVDLYYLLPSPGNGKLKGDELSKFTIKMNGKLSNFGMISLVRKIQIWPPPPFASLLSYVRTFKPFYSLNVTFYFDFILTSTTLIITADRRKK